MDKIDYKTSAWVIKCATEISCVNQKRKLCTSESWRMKKQPGKEDTRLRCQRGKDTAKYFTKVLRNQSLLWYRAMILDRQNHREPATTRGVHVH